MQCILCYGTVRLYELGLAPRNQMLDHGKVGQ
jgi:hypothetical protein